jgi:galactokinase
MNSMVEGKKYGHSGDELIQQLLKDILSGLKKKMVQPVLEENQRVAERLEALKAEDRAMMEELKERLEVLEDRVQQVPLMILAALRDAISQTGGGSFDER